MLCVMQSQGKIVLKVYKTDITLALLAVLPAGISLGLDLLFKAMITFGFSDLAL